MIRRLAWAALVVGAIVMMTSSAMRRRQLTRPLEERVLGVDRLVDAGIQLHVVVADDESGEYLLAGKPKLRVLRTHRLGGIVDTSASPAYVCAMSLNPVQWYCSEDQEPAILHLDEDPLGQLLLGSEGAGKTTALAMWHALRWLEHLGEGREGLQTAPTGARLDLVRAEMFKLWRPSWYRFRVADEIFEFCDGTTIRMVSSYQQSQAGGSRLQGFNASWAGVDEAQDQIDVHEHIEARGRSARTRNGMPWYKQLRTATQKDSSDWRTLRDTLRDAKLPDGTPIWIVRTLLIARSPFVAPGFLELKRSSMSLREYRRRFDVADLPPELATYPNWSRELNLIRVPEIGWEDVTALELARWGVNLQALVGHDPGALFQVSLFTKAYVHNSRAKAYRADRGAGGLNVRPFWVVRGEITTEQATTGEHVAALLEHVRARWNLNMLDRFDRPVKDGPRIFVRADPYGDTETKPDRSVYTVFRNAGVKIEPAAYSVEGGGPGRVDKDAGIEVINTLLCSAAGERRLFVEKDDRGVPVAPKLVEAFETQERDYRGKAETQPKNKKDMSHWPAALRYELWAIERPRLLAMAGAR